MSDTGELFVALSGPGSAGLVGAGSSALLPPLVTAALIPSVGVPWQIKGSLSFTPTIITDTLPPSPVMAWQVPTGKSLLFTGGRFSSLGAGTEYWRVVRRYFMFGYQATAAPAAPAAPAVALAAATSGIGTAGAYLYKTAPVDTFLHEGPVSVASASSTLTATNTTVVVTPAALAAGAAGYNVYRTLAGGSIFYYVGDTLGASAYTDALPDAAIDPTKNGGLDRQPGDANVVAWATGDVKGEVAQGPVELIIEVGVVGLIGAPTKIVYQGSYVDGGRQAFAVTFPTTIGQRIRAKLAGEVANFVAVGVVAGRAHLWRGPTSADIRTRTPFDYGTLNVLGVDAAPSAGSYIVWGVQVIADSARQEATAAIRDNVLMPLNPSGVLIPALGEIVVEVGALAAGVAGVRDVNLNGLLI